RTTPSTSLRGLSGHSRARTTANLPRATSPLRISARARNLIGRRSMPEKRALERARKAKRGGNPATQAAEFVREKIRHVRRDEHGARSTKQYIAFGRDVASSLAEERKHGDEALRQERARGDRSLAEERDRTDETPQEQNDRESLRSTERYAT